MNYSEEITYYTWVNGYIRRIGRRKPKSPKDSSFTVECAYCKGKGIIPDIVFGPRDCPVHGCKGGWLNLDGSPDDYKPCGPCEGTGKEGNDIFGWKPCHFCHGSGLVKVR